MPGNWPPQDFPNLTTSNWVPPPSPMTLRYNCIAWAAGDTTKKWWPDPWGIGAWPSGVRREVTIQGFIDAFMALGYILCADGAPEPGIEKIALYAKPGPVGMLPTHAAIQLDNGNWSSKLGDFEDIEHFRLEALDGPQYGAVVSYLRRIRLIRPAPPTF